MIIPVILSGGSGTRLWPLSRALYPKQLLALLGEATMLQDTVHRVAGIGELGPLYCICNEDHRFLVAEQLRQTGASVAGIVLEPEGRNTAPAAAVAAMLVTRHHPGSLMLVLPADHVIPQGDRFVKAIEAGVAAAEAGKLVTFGVRPHAPVTGYGYIRVPVSDQPVTVPLKIEEFVEKPDQATAESYLEAGNYFWNSGIFLFDARRYLDELQAAAPGIVAACGNALDKAVHDLDFLRLDPASFCASPSDSIDYAVMERTSSGVLVPLDAGWNDVGAWSALWDVHEHDEQGNVSRGDVVLHKVTDSYVHATSRLVTAVGIEGHIIVETSDAVLVASREHVQEVKQIVEQLKSTDREEVLLHRRVYRPWGSYETIDVSDRFKVKRITVNPGAALSLQKHHHRAEHWIVVKGTASVTIGDQVLTLQEDQSTYIPLGVFHRLENITDAMLELIEVQSGSYLGEDDIVRVEDRYGRN